MASSEKQRALPATGTAHSQAASHQHLLHTLFETRCRASPDAIAVVYEDACLTYAALERQSAALACTLQELSIGPECRVALALERGLELVIAILGVLKAAGAYVPLDMSYPGERLQYIVQDAQVQALLTQEALTPLLPSLSCPVLLLDHLLPATPARWPARPPQLHPENCAYIIYTSGSTGRPKGVEISHRAICQTLREYNRELGIQAGMRLLQFAALGFDATVLEVFAPLHAGACLVLARREQLAPGPALLDTLRQQAIGGALVPPSVLAVLAPAPLPDLRLLVSGGEALPAHVVARWAPGRHFYNAYGPTEAAVCSTLARCQEQESTPTIGRPLGTLPIYLLDASLRGVQTGETAGICIGGLSLARGYLGQADLTAGRFLPDPFSNRPGARLYRTGDLGRLRADGQLEFVGREDQQIKIRGFRVEPGEIEARLSQHPLVHEAVVVAREDPPGELRLLAYVTPARVDSPPRASDLKAYLQARLPAYMVPATCVLLAHLPLSAHGKLDRRALPAPTRQQRYLAPRTAQEQQLAQLWETLFHLPRIGVGEDFFELGGHSLLITQLLARIYEMYGVQLPITRLFEAPTIAELARTLPAAPGPGSPGASADLRPLTRQQPLPLTFAQEQVWFLLQLDPHNLAYNAQAIIELHGRLNLQALGRSLDEIVRRHEILRTTFEEGEGRPQQVIHASARASLLVIDLEALPAAARTRRGEQMVQAAVRRPFVLTRLPLVRWLLVRLDAATAWLLHVEHHFVHDGWSFMVFVRELVALYQAFGTGQPSPLPALPIQFADFACWQRQWMQGEVLAGQLAYWKQRLAGSPALLRLPTDHPRPPLQSSRGSALRLELAPSLYTALKALSRQEGCTLFMTMLAALFVLLWRYSDQQDICVGSGVANRRWRESEPLIGMLVNTIVLRADLSGNPAFRGLLQQVRTSTLEAYMHQDLPFGHLVDALRPQRSLSYNPLFQVIFAFHDSPLPDLHLPDLTLRLREGLNNGSAKFDMGLVVIPRGEQTPGRTQEAGITLIWEYNSDLFTRASIQQMASCYQVLLHTIVQAPERPVARLDLLSASGRQDLLNAWQSAAPPAPGPQQCLHRRFERQAALTPDAIALWMQGSGLTYRALNARANRLARRLQQMGVGPEQLVALVLPRSLDMVSTLLAILKAGGAYVPLDPAHPAERLALLLQDLRASVLLTSPALLPALRQVTPTTCLLSADLAPGSERPTDLAGQASAEHLAYVIYTSGSTGQPKGVEISHRGVGNLLDALAARCGVQAGERVLQFASLTFDASVLEIFPALCSGACLVLAEREQVLPGTPLLETLHSEAITWTLLPPSTLAMLAPTPLPALRTLLCGGEACPHELAADWAPGRRFYNAYGPTENSVCATLARCTGSESFLPLGDPLAGVQLALLDASLQPVPPGMAGELYIGGIGLARAYLQQPALTAERFVPHPYSQEAGARLYRTGDLVRYRADGSLEFLGRADQQVKIRGFRIEPGEVEAALLSLPMVEQAAVVACEENGERALNAYLVLRPAAVPDTRAIRQDLKRLLPDYLLPARLIVLDTLPRLPGGKVDRRALPHLAAARQEEISPAAAPRSDLERTISALWQAELHLEQIGREDNFFDLGGHSLAMVRIYRQLSARRQETCSLVDLFRYPTIAALAHYLSRGEATLALEENLARASARRATTSQQRQLRHARRLQGGDERES
ncbi:MAG TPA: amino acid adenylation domain-containing protein [Ktedonobacteraceae bacterium]|jgi:amino acid adenylation domain-containing protein